MLSRKMSVTDPATEALADLYTRVIDAPTAVGRSHALRVECSASKMSVCARHGYVPLQQQLVLLCAHSGGARKVPSWRRGLRPAGALERHPGWGNFAIGSENAAEGAQKEF